MKQYAKIDEKGLFLEDVVVEKIWTDPVYEEDGITVKKEGFYAYPTMDKYHIETLPPKDVSFMKPKWNGTKWVDAPSKEQVQEIAKGAVLAVKSGIEEYVYSFYPERKQSQDRSYQSYSQTVIVGVTSQADTPTTLDALTIEVMGVVLQILEGVITLEDYIASKPADLQEHYEKLVKVGLRLKWTKACIDEGKLAVAEGREPNYPTFPVFGLQRIAS